MLFTQPVSDTVTLSSVSAVADIPLPSSPRDSCARVFVAHDGVDVMKVEAVLRSNNQPILRDHASADVGMPGIHGAIHSYQKSLFCLLMPWLRWRIERIPKANLQDSTTRSHCGQGVDLSIYPRLN